MATRRELQDLARLWHDRWERVLVGQLQELFDRQLAATLAKLREQTKAMDFKAVFDASAWDAETQQVVGGAVAALYDQVGENLFTTFAVDSAWNLHDPKVTEALGERVNKIVGINQTTEDAIRSTLQAGELAGEPTQKLAARIQDVFSTASTTRAVTIARTEVVGASNEANYLAADQSGLELVKSWLATEDERTRDTHLQAEEDNQGIGMDEPFSVGGYDLMYPGDPDGPPQEVINCRCVVLFVDPAGQEEVVSPADGDTLPSADDIVAAMADGEGEAVDAADAVDAGTVGEEPSGPLADAVQSLTDAVSVSDRIDAAVYDDVVATQAAQDLTTSDLDARKLQSAVENVVADRSAASLPRTELDVLKDVVDNRAGVNTGQVNRAFSVPDTTAQRFLNMKTGDTYEMGRFDKTGLEVFNGANQADVQATVTVEDGQRMVVIELQDGFGRAIDAGQFVEQEYGAHDWIVGGRVHVADVRDDHGVVRILLGDTDHPRLVAERVEQAIRDAAEQAARDEAAAARAAARAGTVVEHGPLGTIEPAPFDSGRGGTFVDRTQTARSAMEKVNRDTFVALDRQGINGQVAKQQASEVIEQRLGDVATRDLQFAVPNGDVGQSGLNGQIIQASGGGNLDLTRSLGRADVIYGRDSDGLVRVVSKENFTDEAWQRIVDHGAGRLDINQTEDFRIANLLSSGFQAHSPMTEFAFGDSPRAETLVRQNVVREVLARWAGTSNDADPYALAMQHAVADEFGLTGPSAGYDALHASWDGLSQAEVDQRAAAVFEQAGDAMRSVARAMYDATQEQLAGLGYAPDDTLTLGRGWSFTATPEAGSTAMPEWVLAGHADVTEVKGIEVGRALFRPGSSWTSGVGTMGGFTGGQYGILTYAEIPASRILGMPGAGFGCFHEGEFVVLADNADVTIVRIGYEWQV